MFFEEVAGMSRQVIVLLIMIAFSVCPIMAVASMWDGETDPNWNVATNWDPNVVPIVTDEYCEIYGFWYKPNWPTVFGTVDSPQIILGLGDIDTPVLTVASYSTLNVTDAIDTGWYSGQDRMVIDPNGTVNCYDPSPNIKDGVFLTGEGIAQFRLGESKNPDAVDPNHPTFDERAYSEVYVNSGAYLYTEWLRFGFYNFWTGTHDDYVDFGGTNRGAYGEIIVDGGWLDVGMYGPWPNWPNYSYRYNHDGTGIHMKSGVGSMVTFAWDNTQSSLYGDREIIVDDGWGKAVFTNDEEVSPGVWRDVYRAEPYIPGTDIRRAAGWFQWDNRGRTRSVHDNYNYGLKDENTPGAGAGTIASYNQNKIPWPGDALWLPGNTNLGEHPICDVDFYLGHLVIGEKLNYNLHPLRTVDEGFEVVAGGSLTVVDYDETDPSITSPGAIILGGSRLCGVEDTGRGTLIMNGGTVSCGDIINGWGGSQLGYDFPDDLYWGEGTIQMNEGAIDCNMVSMAILAVPLAGGDPNVVGSGTINLLGGTINIRNDSGLINVGGSNGIYVTGGTIIIHGDMAAELTALIGTKITTSAGRTVDIDYNTTNPGKTTLTSSCPNGVDVGDLDFDCDVDIDDVVVMAVDWLKSSCTGDISGNCFVDYVDFASLSDNWDPNP